MLVVFRNEMRLLLRDRSVILWSLVAPILFISLIVAARYEGADTPEMLLPVVDEDQGPVAAAFVKLLGERAEVVRMTRPEAEALVREQGRAAATLVFPAGLSKRYLAGRGSEVLLLTDPAESVGVGRVKALLLLMDREASALADPVGPDRVAVVERNLTGDRLTRHSHEQNVPGFTVMFTLIAVVFGTAASLHRENDWGTTARLLISPVGFTRILLGKLGARHAIGTVQMLVLLLWGHFAFGVSLGSSVVALVVVVIACVFATVSLAMLVAGLARTASQTLPLCLGAVLPLAAVGGLWWPVHTEPIWMQGLAPAAFPTWAMRALTDLVLRDRGLQAVAWPSAVLLAQGAVLLAVGMRLFRAQFGTR